MVRGRTTSGVPDDPEGQAAGSRAQAHFRLRYDTTDSQGAMTGRRVARPEGVERAGATLAGEERDLRVRFGPRRDRTSPRTRSGQR